MTPSKDVLIRARGLIEKGWCRGTYAQSQGVVVNPRDPTATAFCVRGAVIAASVDLADRHHPFALLETALGQIDKTQHTLASYNDDPERTSAEILALFDAAITLESKGADDER